MGPFGFGRRCPPQLCHHTFEYKSLTTEYALDVIYDSPWIAMSTLLATSSISTAVDSDSKEITPGTAVEAGVAR